MTLPLPKIALVGRPNVGKSSLFNRICERRIAIVDESEGVTRDRLYAEAEYFGVPFRLIDSGGIDRRSDAPFTQEICHQSDLAIQEADVVILVVDGKMGLTGLDSDLTQYLLKLRKPTVLAVNKVDTIDHNYMLSPFYQLGIKGVIGVSAVQGHRLAELLESALDLLPMTEASENLFDKDEEKKPMKIALVGKPNAGKSTLMNLLLDEERCMVSPIPGTTRDTIDADVIFQEKIYTFIDTAGIRRKAAEIEVVDKYAAIRTQEAVERSDLCILLLDATQGITVQDKKIANQIEEAGKGMIVLFNKWDLVKGFRMEHCKQAAILEVPFLAHCPMLFISALSGRNTEKLFPLIEEVAEATVQKIGTGRLNRFVAKVLQVRHPPMIQGRRLRIYYMTQIGVQPPTFVLFVNRADLMDPSYQRFLMNQLRKEFAFAGTPLKMKLRGKHDEGAANRRKSKEKLEAITPLLARQGEDSLEHEGYDHENYDDYEDAGHLVEDAPHSAEHSKE